MWDRACSTVEWGMALAQLSYVRRKLAEQVRFKLSGSRERETERTAAEQLDNETHNTIMPCFINTVASGRRLIDQTRRCRSEEPSLWFARPQKDEFCRCFLGELTMQITPPPIKNFRGADATGPALSVSPLLLLSFVYWRLSVALVTVRSGRFIPTPAPHNTDHQLIFLRKIIRGSSSTIISADHRWGKRMLACRMRDIADFSNYKRRR